MTRGLTITSVILITAAAINIAAIDRIKPERETLKKEQGVGFLLPSPIYKIVSLEFKGILSDIIFSSIFTYYGKKSLTKEKLTPGEWGWIYSGADVVTDLDPYFLDPYLFASSVLAWDADMAKEANTLLEKANLSRNWDWTIPFYLGFNYFYFLQDADKAEKYLMAAAKRPGAGKVIPTLASRLAYKARQTENAIYFLQGVLENTEEENLRWIYNVRLDALKKIRYLEIAIDRYKEHFNQTPANLDRLIETGIIKEIPSDPYKGTFYVSDDGTVKTTSNLTFK